MKKNKTIFIAFLVILMIVGCQKKSSEAMLKVYAVEESEVGSENFTMNNKLLFTDLDIKEYKWETHEIIFTDEFLNKLNSNLSEEDDGEKVDFSIKGGSTLFGTSQRDGFIVMVNEEKIYDGYFEQSMLSSFYPIGAVIIDTNDGIRIDFNGIDGADEDVRSDERIYKVLEDRDIIR